MGAPVVDITIAKGKTFEFAYRYADENLVYLPISGIPSTTPVRLTVTAHGIPDGWPVRVEGLKQPEELNNDFSGCASYYFAKVINEDTIELNRVSAAGWRSYSGGGSVVIHQPYDLTGHSARMQVRDRVHGSILLTLSSDAFADRDGSIELDTALSSIIVKLEPPVTADIAWRTGVYDLELITPDGDVYPVTDVSRVSVGPEVTR